MMAKLRSKKNRRENEERRRRGRTKHGKRNVKKRKKKQAVSGHAKVVGQVTVLSLAMEAKERWRMTLETTRRRWRPRRLRRWRYRDGWT